MEKNAFFTFIQQELKNDQIKFNSRFAWTIDAWPCFAYKPSHIFCTNGGKQKKQYMVILSGDIGQFNISNLVGYTPYSNGFKTRAGLLGAVKDMKTKFLPSIEYA